VNVNRRDFLKGAASAPLIAGAGCLNDGGSGGSTTTLNLGEAIVRKNIKIGVAGYVTVDRMAIFEREEPRSAQNPTGPDYLTPKTPGAQYLLVYVIAQHVGESSQFFPSGEEDSTLYYDGETVRNVLPPYVFTDGQREYPSYYGAVTYAKAKERGAFPPFRAEGYQVYEVPRQFDPQLVEVEITWGWSQGRRGLTGGNATRWSITQGENRTADEPPTSSSHGSQVPTRTEQYETTTSGEGYTPTYDTITNRDD
jgi:hypothetical protein